MSPSTSRSPHHITSHPTSPSTHAFASHLIDPCCLSSLVPFPLPFFSPLGPLRSVATPGPGRPGLLHCCSCLHPCSCRPCRRHAAMPLCRPCFTSIPSTTSHSTGLAMCRATCTPMQLAVPRRTAHGPAGTKYHGLCLDYGRYVPTYITHCLFRGLRCVALSYVCMYGWLDG